MARLIDADVFKKNMDYVCTMGGWLEPVSSAITEYVKKHIDAQPTIDAVSVVRCKECKYASDNKVYGCMLNHFNDDDYHRMYADDFCSYGERGGE